MQVALIDLITKGVSDYSLIKEVVHAEFNTSVTRYSERTRSLLAAISPNATFSYSASPPPSYTEHGDSGSGGKSASIRGRVYIEVVSLDLTS